MRALDLSADQKSRIAIAVFLAATDRRSMET